MSGEISCEKLRWGGYDYFKRSSYLHRRLSIILIVIILLLIYISLGDPVIIPAVARSLQMLPGSTMSTAPTNTSFNISTQEAIATPAYAEVFPITVVTAFFRFPPFEKGEPGIIFTPDLYKDWMKNWALMRAPVVAYFDQKDDLNFFVNVRKVFPPYLTTVHQVNRSDLWAWSLYGNVTRIIKSPGYPVHKPPTYIAAYPCAMNAKYELVLKTSQDNPYKTSYITWIDIGLFRHQNDLLGNLQDNFFGLDLPPNFDKDKISYKEVYSRQVGAGAEEIFKQKIDWVCGCMFLGAIDLMINWTKDYISAVEYYLRQGLAGADQQVLHAMINEKKTNINLQIYQSNYGLNVDPWFELGYLCKLSWERKRKHVQFRNGTPVMQ